LLEGGRFGVGGGRFDEGFGVVGGVMEAAEERVKGGGLDATEDCDIKGGGPFTRFCNHDIARSLNPGHSTAISIKTE